MNDLTKMMPIKVEPFKHQVDGWWDALECFNEGGEGYGLFFEMGCGKSLTAIAIIGSLPVKRVLIVAPSSVCAVWPRELKDYADFRYAVLYPTGTVKQRADSINAFSAAEPTVYGRQIVVINYEAAWRMEDTLRAFYPDMIICDESQKIKNPTARASKCMHRLGDLAMYKLCLTGTPIQNKPLDFWSQYKFLNPKIFGNSFYQFRARYAVMGGMCVNGKPVQVVGYKNLDELTEKAYTCAMRVRKADCLDLPEKTFETRYVELSKEEEKLYRQMKRENIAFIGEQAVTAQIVLTRLLILQRLTGGFMRPDESEQSIQIGHSKLDALEEIIEDCIDAEQKLVVFVRFTDEYHAVRQMLEEKSITYSCISGATSQRARGYEVERFQNDPRCKVFVGQIEAAGTGITLTAASVAVFYSPTWNYATYMQAQDRIHRIGQKDECHYINLIAPGTVDEDVMKALAAKRNLADMVVDGMVKLND